VEGEDGIARAGRRQLGEGTDRGGGGTRRRWLGEGPQAKSRRMVVLVSARLNGELQKRRVPLGRRQLRLGPAKHGSGPRGAAPSRHAGWRVRGGGSLGSEQWMVVRADYRQGGVSA
jgi:hypothetical protein